MNTETTATTRQPAASSLKRVNLETAVALVATGVLGLLLFLCAICAGPLWRDEANTINVALMPIKELWSNLPFESFPPLWLVLLRAWNFLGMAGSDGGIRLLSFFVGLSFLGCTWLCSSWIGGRAPTVTLALLGSLPAFLFTVSSNRAYGLAMCLVVLTYATVWRVVQSPSRSRILCAGITSLLLVHCLYYNIFFLGAILFGAAMVTLRRRQPKTLGALVGIGTLACGTLVVYRNIIHMGSVHSQIMKGPFDFRLLWIKLSDSLSKRSSGELPGSEPSLIWFWLLLILAGILVAAKMQNKQARIAGLESGRANCVESTNADLALFSILSLILALVLYVSFLFRLRFPTQAWYYMVMLTPCAVSLDAILGASWQPFRPWGLVRVILLLGLATWSGHSVWREAHTRRSNVDLIAAILNEKAKEGDLIVVQSAFEAITFDRYYHGSAKWMSVPPINSHKVHRSDLIWQKMNEPNAMAPVLGAATQCLQNGNSVWVAGHIAMTDSQRMTSPPPAPNKGGRLGDYARYWGAQLTVHLLDRAMESRLLTSTLDFPVHVYEDLPLRRFSGYKPGSEKSSVVGPTARKQ